MQVSNFDVVSGRLGTDITNSAVFALNLPAGKTPGLYAGDHRLGIPGQGGQEYGVYEGRIGVTFPTPGQVQVQNTSGRTFLAGQQVYLQLERPGANANMLPALPDRCRFANMIMCDLGSPLAASAAGLAASQAVTAASPTGAVLLKTTLDVPRNVVAAWTTTAVLTVRGKDEFGQAMTESSASGAAFTGKKAFFAIDSIKVSANVTALTAGWGALLGMPVFINAKSEMIRLYSGASQWVDQFSGLAVGDTATPTATTGDVRGTYNAAASPTLNGTNPVTIQITAFDINYRGRTQFAG